MDICIAGDLDSIFIALKSGFKSSAPKEFSP
jgi:hypothetical protein